MVTEIDREIEVKISLKRPSDGDMSEPIPFIYTPEDSGTSLLVTVFIATCVCTNVYVFMFVGM